MIAATATRRSVRGFGPAHWQVASIFNDSELADMATSQGVTCRSQTLGRASLELLTGLLHGHWHSGPSFTESQRDTGPAISNLRYQRKFGIDRTFATKTDIDTVLAGVHRDKRVHESCHRSHSTNLFKLLLDRGGMLYSPRSPGQGCNVEPALRQWPGSQWPLNSLIFARAQSACVSWPLY